MKNNYKQTTAAYSASEQLTAKGFLAIVFLLVLTLSVFSQPCQCGSGRYLQPIFGKTSLGTNVQYTQNASTKYDGTIVQCSMDIWGPAGDNCSRRPVIIWIHGGGFSQQNKTAPDVVAMCDTFSRRGFVVASIDYRDGYWGTGGPVNQTYSVNPTPYDHYEFTRADYRAMQDAKCAVRFFKANASTYGIDTSNIFMGGTSAGGWTSLMVAYLDKASEKPVSANAQVAVIGTYARPDLGGIDGNGGWSNASSKVKGIISIFGATIDTSLVDGPTDPAAYHFHEYSDPVVNFYYGAPFQGQYQNFDSYWGDYYVDLQSKNMGGVSKSHWVSGNQHSLYPYRGIVTTDVSSFLDSIICASGQTTGINTTVNSLNVSVYPNPSAGAISIDIPFDVEENSSLKIYDMPGSEVFSTVLSQGSNKIDLQSLANGAYLLRMSDGIKQYNQRVLLSK